MRVEPPDPGSAKIFGDYASSSGSFHLLAQTPADVAEADADVYFPKLSLVAKLLALLDSLRRCFSFWASSK